MLWTRLLSQEGMWLEFRGCFGGIPPSQYVACGYISACVLKNKKTMNRTSNVSAVGDIPDDDAPRGHAPW